VKFQNRWMLLSIGASFGCHPRSIRYLADSYPFLSFVAASSKRIVEYRSCWVRTNEVFPAAGGNICQLPDIGR
jgi:hypothetical protein